MSRHHESEIRRVLAEHHVLIDDEEYDPEDGPLVTCLCGWFGTDLVEVADHVAHLGDVLCAIDFDQGALIADWEYDLLVAEGDPEATP